ncbi:hypothetical protein HYT05_02570 [Candidatus Kaiserbacteria bacterium]|nr:hypothetical protein [Candidatus Kaiserbacteria bacterium]
MSYVAMPRIEQFDSVRYRDYLAFLTKVFTYFKTHFAKIEAENGVSDAESVAEFAERFLATIRSLRMKDMYSSSYLRRPGVDIMYSGFPNAHDIDALVGDLATRTERLAKLPSVEVLKEIILESVMTVPRPGDEVSHIAKRVNRQYHLSERIFLEELNMNTQFYQFTPGKLRLVGDEEYREEGRRAYTYAWGCYDRLLNEPCVYTLLFTQDVHEAVFDTESAGFYKFIDTIRHIADRVPDNLKILAMMLDDGFMTLYPKRLNRVRIGPLVSPLFYQGDAAFEPESLAARILPVFKRAGSALDDFVLFFDVEGVESLGERPSELKEYGYEKPQQRFFVQEADAEMGRRGVSVLQKYVIMPHWLAQHLTAEDTHNLHELYGTSRLVYQQDEGVLTHVG